MPRYVILRHDLPPTADRGLHWDLMFETTGVLRTWAVDAEPFSAASWPARQLADHRLAYLDYEGPVSGDRGVVSRWDAGDYLVEHESDGHWQLTLSGGRIAGQLTFDRTADDAQCWIVSFVRASRGD